MIREAVPEDAPLLARLLRESFEEYRGRLDPPSSAHGVFFHPRPDHVYLDRLAVLPPFRGRGLARALIDTVEARARALGPQPVRLSVRLALEDHQAYYQRLGYAFRDHGTHEGYSAPTFVILEKRL